ncbi:MAG: GNAT family N-acetyltransferase [Bacillota bacterium]|nr:GNAT family N-acetyltransferase [Bacillota bacterium]
MDKIIYKYIDCRNKIFDQVINLRYDILFKPYSMVEKYEYDELDEISLHLVVLDKEKLAGYSRLTNFDGIGKITNVVVDPEYIGRGIGSEMIKKHIAKAKGYSINCIYLNSRQDTVNFYEKIGFQCDDEASISERSGLLLQKMHINIS